MNDLALLVSSIHTQFKVADPTAAELFRLGITNMAMDANGPFWNAGGGQKGIIIQKPKLDD